MTTGTDHATAPATPSLFDAPAAPTSIFAVMSRLAHEHDAVNLGQGFPDFAPDAALTDRLAYHARHSSNQYAPLPGVPRLLRAIADKIERCHGVRVDQARELTVTSGATQGIWTAVQALVCPGDEAIVFEPAYDSYVPAVESVGGVAVPLPLKPEHGFRPDWAGFAARLNARTRLVILNNPHNPTGTCWRDEDLRELEHLLRGREVAVLSDEVYEHLVYDGREHLSALRYPGLRERAVVTCSFGKTFHVTGWKVGYAVAPPALTARLRSVHQYTVFTVSTPAQHALADHLGEPAHYESLPGFFAANRDRLAGGLAGSRLRLLPNEGSYFALADYGEVIDEPDTRFAERLVRECGVAVIPISPFYTEAPAGQTLVRLCFAKRVETLDAAAVRLREL